MFYIIVFFVVGFIVLALRETFGRMSDKEFLQRRKESNEFIEKHGKLPAHFKEYHDYLHKANTHQRAPSVKF